MSSGQWSHRPPSSRESGFTPREGDEGPARDAAGPGFFHTMGVPILAGRDFDSRDTEKSPRVAIVNENFARFYFGNRNPLGRHIGPGGEAKPDFEIVGVVKGGKYASLREETPRFWYIPYEQYDNLSQLHLYARTAGDPLAVTAEIRRRIAGVDRNVPVYGVTTLDMVIAGDLVTDRMMAMLSSFFSLLAAMLTSIGLYGVMAYSVTRRTREIGLRMALGAQRTEVLWLVLREVTMVVCLGIAIGLPAALVLKRFVASMRYGVSGAEASAMAGAVAIMAGVALFAGYLPARRAARVDPMVALRYE